MRTIIVLPLVTVLAIIFLGLVIRLVEVSVEVLAEVLV